MKQVVIYSMILKITDIFCADLLVARNSIDIQRNPKAGTGKSS